MPKSMPSSPSRSYSIRGIMAVARSRVLVDCRPQNPSIATPFSARCWGVMLSASGPRRFDCKKPLAPRSPVTFRIFSAKTGPYSTQCPSPSMTGCVSPFRTSSGVWCALIWPSPTGEVRFGEAYAPGPTQVKLTHRGRVDRGRHGPHSWKDLLGEQPKALLRLGPRHPTIEEVDDHHLQADRVLQRPDLLDDLVGSPDRLGRAACREARVGDSDVGGLALEVLLVAGNARVARVVPLEVVMLGREELVVEVRPSLLGLRGGLCAVHPQERGGLVRRQPHRHADRVEPPHLRRHLVEARAGDEHLAEPVLGGHPCGGFGGERRLDARGELAFVPRLWAD